MADIVSFKGGKVEPTKPLVAMPAEQLLSELLDDIKKGKYSNGPILVFATSLPDNAMTLQCNVISADPVQKLAAISLMAKAKKTIINILTAYEIDSEA